MPLYKVKNPTNQTIKPHKHKNLTKNLLFFIHKIGDTRFCSVLTNLFRKLLSDFKSSPDREMLKKYILFFSSFLPTVFHLSWFRWAGKYSNWKRNLVKNKNKRRSTPTPTEVSRNISISFCNPCIQILKNQLKISKRKVQIFLGLNVNHSWFYCVSSLHSGAWPHVLILALTSVVNQNLMLKITQKIPQQHHPSVLLAERWQKHCRIIFKQWMSGWWLLVWPQICIYIYICTYIHIHNLYIHIISTIIKKL